MSINWLIFVRFPKFFHYHKVSTEHFIICNMQLKKVRRSNEKKKMKICNFRTIIFCMLKSILLESSIFADFKYIICFCMGPIIFRRRYHLYTGLCIFRIFTFWQKIQKDGRLTLMSYIRNMLVAYIYLWTNRYALLN